MISTAESNGAALTLLQNRLVPPTLVISNMGCRKGAKHRRTAGQDLIREGRAQRIDVPIFVYASTDAVGKYADSVREFWDNGITVSPSELFQFIDKSTT